MAPEKRYHYYDTKKFNPERNPPMGWRRLSDSFDRVRRLAHGLTQIFPRIRTRVLLATLRAQ
jgi:hypothetical protein